MIASQILLILIVIPTGNCAVANNFRNADISEIYPEVGFLLDREIQAKSDEGSHFVQPPGSSHPVHVRTWPRTRLSVGEISGVAVDGDNPVIFHRGNRVFDEKSFNGSNYYRHAEDGPIAEDTILVLNVSNGQVLRSWGKNRFYLPHGLSVDGDGNTWVTDVGLHQVMKFTPDSDEPVLTFGEAFVPGHDQFHFCKPTDVAVASNGEFYIADGYCNSRIIKFTAAGELIKEWGHTATSRPMFAIPHGITLIEEQDLLCVADRENARVVCFSAGLNRETMAGNFVYQVSTQRLGKAYGVAYGGNGLLYGIAWDEAVTPSGFTIDVDSGDIVDAWAPREGFRSPHDIAVSPKGNSLYVSEIGPNRLFKFELP